MKNTFISSTVGERWRSDDKTDEWRQHSPRIRSHTSTEVPANTPSNWPIAGSLPTTHPPKQVTHRSQDFVKTPANFHSCLHSYLRGHPPAHQWGTQHNSFFIGNAPRINTRTLTFQRYSFFFFVSSTVPHRQLVQSAPPLLQAAGSAQNGPYTRLEDGTR